MPSEPSEPIRLRRLPRAWRLTATAAVLGVLATAQFVDTNDWFPFGSLSQYATARDLNGTVKSISIEAVNASGETLRVPLNQTGVGVGRAEIEGQLGRILADPALLQSIADAHAGLHPDEPAYTELTVVRSTRALVDGRPSGEPTHEALATWTVQP
ncbi:hypothetical protein [Cellulomonas timonensis]|uniref:hypothetical protein n=1 Tax=Cellulomonas timonensis TaxID=1689271 RepID=UPI00082B023F|nr:hypothetical protein [Cellulomonas timonensis]